MILADTSAWVEFDRATGSPVDLRLAHLISRSRSLAVTEPVMAEVCAGARTDEREAALRRLLGRCRLLSFDAGADFDAAVGIYRRCRKAGVTPRGLIDCMIASAKISRPGLPEIAPVTEFRDVYGVALTNMINGADPATELRKATAEFQPVLDKSEKA